MSSAKLKANSEWLIWARKTAYYDVNEIAKRMKVEKDTIKEWENTGNIEYNELVKLAEHYQRPPMIFFNANKPEYKDPIPDFRTIKSKKKDSITPEISFEIRSAIVRRKNLFQLEEESNEYEIPQFVLKDVNTRDPAKISEIIRDKIRMNKTNMDLRDLDHWIKRIEDLGVLVFQFYGLEPKDIRGYALYYDKLPIIGINSREYTNGKMFTLFHELAHIITKEEGVSNFYNYYLKGDEKRCNRIAAETLVPSRMLETIIEDRNYSTDWDDKTIKELSSYFKVSNEVIVRRLLTLRLATEEDYQAKKETWNTYIEKSTRSRKNNHKTKKDTQETRETKPDPQRKYRNQAAMALKRNGMYYTKSILDAYDENLISIDDVAEDLGVSIEVIREIRNRLVWGN